MVTTSARQKELLEHCASEPIHRLGRVQAFGMLMAIDARTLRISFVSANADAWTGRAAADMLGQRADAVLTRRNVEAALAHADVARARGTAQHLRKVCNSPTSTVIAGRLSALQHLTLMEWAPGMVPTNRRWWAPWRVEQGSANRRAGNMIGRSRRTWSSRPCRQAHL